MLSSQNTALVVLDVQEKLWRVMYEKESASTNLTRIIKGVQILGIPIILTEQYPDGLGHTIAEAARLLPDLQPISKLAFNCCDDERFSQELEDLNRKQLLIAGIEAHVCVYQTAVGLLSSGYEVQIVADAVSSRTPENRQIGLERARNAGATLTSTETALFELVKVGRGAAFKEILEIVK